MSDSFFLLTDVCSLRDENSSNRSTEFAPRFVFCIPKIFKHRSVRAVRPTSQGENSKWGKGQFYLMEEIKGNKDMSRQYLCGWLDFI